MNFWNHVIRTEGCWLWQGSIGNHGYGIYGKPQVLAHRRAYEVLVAEIPAGKTLDHLCRNRLCVNPEHLEPVSLVENVMRGESPPARNARKTHCPHGHLLDGLRGNGSRYCLTCNRVRARLVCV